MGSEIQSKTFFSASDLRDIRKAMGADPFKSVSTEPPQDGLKDVLITAPTGGLKLEGEGLSLEDHLKQQGVTVGETLPQVGVTARVDAKQLEALQAKGFGVFDDSSIQLMSGQQAHVTGKGQVMTILDNGVEVLPPGAARESQPEEGSVFLGGAGFAAPLVAGHLAALIQGDPELIKELTDGPPGSPPPPQG